MIRPFFILLVLIAHPCLQFGQTYVAYHRTFNHVDEDILQSHFENAITRLDSIYNTYDFIFARHAFKALQICVTVNDSIRSNQWLETCFIQGIPLWMIRANDITRKSLAYSTTNYTEQRYDSLHQVYLSHIDTALSRTLDSLLIIDQQYTDKVNHGFVLLRPLHWLQWGNNNKRQLVTFKKLIAEHGYPEEKLIGLPLIQDSARFGHHFEFWGPNEIRDSKMQIMLQHCFSTRHQVDMEFQKTLFDNVNNGNMPPFQYGIVMDFMLPDRKKYMGHHYHNYSKKCDQDCVAIINQNRHIIGLNTLSEAEQHRVLYRERRKNKTVNKEIVVE